MRKTLLISLLLSIGLAGSAVARDDRLRYSINEALALGQAEGKLNPAVTLYFGKQIPDSNLSKVDTIQSNKKTNAFGKSDKFACQWAFLSAMIDLQHHAILSGGNAVINIQSFYKKNQLISETEFECGAGTSVAGVTMIGDVAKRDKK